jgi:aminomethyltransferase
MANRTALYDIHVALGGRIIDFGGWDLPVQYSGVMDEHLACRQSVGIFDVSHMGEVHVEGKNSEAFLNYLVTNDLGKVAIGQAQYTVMCHSHGGVVDDLVIYRRASDRFLLVVNASNTDKDFKHIQSVYESVRSKFPDLKITNESAKYTQIALQGRNAAQILQKLTVTPLAPIKNYWFSEGFVLNTIPAILARTGYTGEDGFEIYVPWDSGPQVWNALMKTGEEFAIKPCGLGARDTLRLEMKYPLYGHELSDEGNPLEAGSGWVIKLDKPDFVGKSALVASKAKGLASSLVGLKLLDRGIPRQGYAVFSEDGATRVGEVKSGTQSPSLKTSIGIASVPLSLAKVGTKLTVDIRGTKAAAEVVATPFYKRPY